MEMSPAFLLRVHGLNVEEYSVRIALVAGLLACLLMGDEPGVRVPKLLLSGKLLRRLKRDKERQTTRWVAFENRVRNVADSPERGFELALYYAVTGDEARGNEAIAWAAEHGCERRQRALIQDWVGEVAAVPCPVPASLRDEAFAQILAGGDTSDIAQQVRTQLIPKLAESGVTKTADLYALLELLGVLRSNSDKDIRNADGVFFRNLPMEFLLSMKPALLEKPDWMTHVAALALVSVDPNLEASQFLQGWAMEDKQTLREGPGVAYELLWADPYLPGIAYQNMDPWIYDDEHARLFARSDWNADACWISISKTGVKEVNCPRGWQGQIVHFGQMTLIPAPAKCVEIPKVDIRQSIVIWNLNAGEALYFPPRKEPAARAGESGIWHPGSNVEGKVCRR